MISTASDSRHKLHMVVASCVMHHRVRLSPLYKYAMLNHQQLIMDYELMLGWMHSVWLACDEALICIGIYI
jgi:hypothetical protein